ncbi:MAG: cytochrome c maturation protein CcmE [Anaerolineae bacterium]|nr:cytochrome c maturation protein CcmE [Anaerolineae bacterium]
MNKRNFLVAGALIVVAVGYLIFSSTGSTASFFLTIEELQTMGQAALERDVTVSGAVIGDSIVYDATQPRLSFAIVHIPGDQDVIEAAGGLAKVLHEAVTAATGPRLYVVYEDIKPDLLQDEAQAIVRGRLQPDGTFLAHELLLKCPSRYAEEIPNQIEE